MSTRCSEEDDEAERCRELVLGSIDLAGKLAVATMLGPLKKLGFWVNRKQLKDIPRKYDQLLDKILNEHEERAKKDGDEREDKDLMDILLQIYHDKDAEFKISKNQIKAFIMWIIAELINHPNVLKKLKEEIESIVETKRLVEDSDIPNLHYLEAVVKETLRLHPTIPGEDCKIGGFDIPKETAVVINAYSIMRDPNFWEDPNEFYPERFLQEQDNNQKEIKRQNFSFLPFGGGRRLCPGSHLAFSIIPITIASMVQCFDWKFAGKGDGDNKVDMQAKAGMSLCLANPLLCLPVIRFNPFTA
ncbi:hypothetical protein P3X46_013090 [Hevea brasiliensis]|uniref:Cytochrome P450 n=1 Tax=Hevea brasiliensis TaxID=3981 RepID=A0ABQ9M2F2_HEVBR|nr:hypothetical protein P3X46_013090 [Hevea brasiliensis]